MNSYKLSSLSFTFMFICIVNAMLPGTLFPYMIYMSNTSIFISLGSSYVIGLGIIYFFLKIFNFLPSKNIFGKIESIFSYRVSKIMSSIIVILIFSYMIMLFWRYSTFISLEFLTETPNSFVTFIVIIPVIYLSLYDIETTSRVSYFCVLVGVILFLINFISLLGFFEIDNFKPLLNNDFRHLSISSVMFSVVSIGTILSLLVIPKDNIIDKEKFNKTLIIGYSINYVCVSLIYFSIIGTLGVELARLFTFPSYEVLKTINMFSFLDNIENLNISIWILFMSLSLAYNTLIIKYGICYIFNISNKKKLNIINSMFILLSIIIVISLIPYENVISKYKRYYAYAPFIVISSSIVITFVIYLIGKIKYK